MKILKSPIIQTIFYLLLENVVVFFMFLMYLGYCTDVKGETLNLNLVDDTTIEVVDSSNIENDINIEDSVYNKLHEEVSLYINTYHKNYDKNLPLYMIKYAKEYNIDLSFMMAQSLIETSFGKGGIGRPNSRYSLFGVMRRYNNYDHAVKDYCDLIRTKYLGERKSVHDLMRSYRSLSGHKYAGNSRYERELSKQYHKINNTNIGKLWKQYQAL